MKDLLKNKFKIDGKKSFNYQEYLKNVKKIGFHEPEWRIRFRNTFPLDEKKIIIGSNVWKLDRFPLSRNPCALTEIQDSFINTLPLDGNMELVVIGVSVNGVRKSVSTSTNKVIFQNLNFPVSTSRKNLRIKE